MCRNYDKYKSSMFISDSSVNTLHLSNKPSAKCPTKNAQNEIPPTPSFSSFAEHLPSTSDRKLYGFQRGSMVSFSSYMHCEAYYVEKDR